MLPVPLSSRKRAQTRGSTGKNPSAEVSRRGRDLCRCIGSVLVDRLEGLAPLFDSEVVDLVVLSLFPEGQDDKRLGGALVFKPVEYSAGDVGKRAGSNVVNVVVKV